MRQRGSGIATERASSQNTGTRSRNIAILGVSLLTIAALIAGAMHPQGRVWGLNHWAYWGPSAHWIFAGACAVLFALAGWVLGRGDHGDTPPAERASPSSGRSWLEIIILGAFFGFVFFAGRAHTHFLGDGYQTIALLGTDPPAVKETAPLLRAVLPHVRSFFGAGEEGARRTYQFLSIASGVAFILAIAAFAKLFFSSRLDRGLFVVSCAAGGFAVLFFGYVENYAPFTALTAITFLTGIAVLDGKLARLWLLPPALLMMSTHVFGILALPAVAFVFLSSEPARRLLSRRRMVWALLAAALIAALAAATHSAFQDIRVQVALVPIASTWHASEGYTLFSRKHLVDLANLLFLLFPGWVLCATFALMAPTPTPFRRSLLAFTLLFLLTLWTGVFVLSPGLGMPRDWDLFAFAGAPLVLFASLWILRNPAPERRLAMACSIVLGLAVLIPRVVEARRAEVAILHFRNYLELDRARGRNGYFHLVRHYRSIGRDDLAEAQIREWEALYPERNLMRQADAFHRGGKPHDAIRICREALAINSAHNEAYMVLGEASLLLRDYATARVAAMRAFALSADPLRCTFTAGMACAGLGQFEEAESWLRKALALAPDSFSVNLNYAVVCKNLGRVECFEKFLERATKTKGADPAIIEEAKKVPWPAKPAARGAS